VPLTVLREEQVVFARLRKLRRAVAAGGGTALLTAGLVALAAPQAMAAATGGSGASLPYVEVQAENSATNGSLIGPSWTAGQLADEASYRKAVTLQGSGKYVTFTTPVATNSIDFRYSIPDTGGGSVYTAPLAFSVNGAAQADFTLTNAYSWYYGSYPFTNTPGSNPHHFYDEAHRLLSQTYPAGTTFTLQVPSGGTATTIDFADFENVGPALGQPSGSVSVTSKGADASGAADSTAAFNAAISAAGSGGTVWIPPGTFKVPGHIAVNNVTIAGAGMWYSTVTGAAPGFYGNSAPSASSGVHLQNFAIFGDVQERNDSAQVNGIGGAMSNSSVTNLWIDHLKVGAWMDGPMNGLTFSGMRIRDTTADGINFHGGVTNSKVTNSDIRNTGDDGIATWADSGLGADANDTISDNTVSLQILANAIAIYGGHDNTVSGNLVKDTGLAQGGGIHVGQRFTSTPVGTTTISDNTLIRAGSLDPNWQFGVGALWFDGSQGAITGPINVSNALIEQSPYEAVQWVEGTISGVNLSNVTIAGTGTFALQEQTGGAARFTNVTATGVGASSPVYSCEGGNFVVTDGGGNSGISGTPLCGGWPTPVFPPYPSEGVTANPSALNFGAVATGSTSPAQTVTVSNPTGSAAAVSSIAATGDFAQTNTCGSSIPANGSCSVSVTFRPTATGNRTGTLTVGAGGTTSTVSLSGTGTAPGPVLNANPASLSFGGTVVGATAAAQTVTLTNSGTSSATVSAVSVSAGSGDFSQTNNCSTIAVGASCAVTVSFRPAAGGARTGTLSVTSNANNSPSTVQLSGTGIDSSTNIAAGRTASASSSNGSYTPANLTDADASTYWESNNGAFPQWAQVDLGQSYGVGKVVLKLPPSTAWATRQETLSVQGSADGSSFSTIVGSAAYTFDPNADNNTVTITFASATARYVRVNITANSGWSAGQLSDFEVFPSGSGGSSQATLSAAPASLTFASQAPGTTSAAQTVTVTNTGTAAAAVSGVTATGDFAQTSTCGSSIAAGGHCTVSVTFAPTTSGTRTGTLTVSSNASNNPLTVALTGTGSGTVSTNLAAGRPTSESSHTDVYPSSHVTDGDRNSYWESVNSAFPQWVQVDLGSAQSAGRVVLQLPASWGARSETLTLSGSTDGSNFTTLKASAAYTFDPNTNQNTVTITFGAATERYVRATFTANTGWPAGQLSEFQVWNS
jgi:F5/8 type C domain/Abnormal spindle-like microcephaly-assoc'd, ASPM-SPD-2-Hydin/Right handed beta helix region